MRLKIKLINSFPALYRLYPIKTIILENKIFLESQIKNLEKYLYTQYKIFDGSNINFEQGNFIPSKTAINNLNFIINSDEEKLKNFNIENGTLIDIIRIIYILIEENYENIPKIDLMKNLFKIMNKKLKMNQISKYNFFNS